MGVFQPEVSHGSQSSSRSNAFRLWWEQVNIRAWSLRAWSLAGVIGIAIALLITLYIRSQSSKQIILEIDGKVHTLETREALLGEALGKQLIPLKPYDKISAGLSDRIEDGDRIVIDRAQELILTEGGKTKTLYTTEDTIGQAISSLGIALGAHDKVFPSLDTAITARTEVKVIRINKQVVKRMKSLPFRVIKTADPSLTAGKVRVAQAGKPGVIVQHIEKTYQDGKLVSMRMVGKEVQTVTKNKVIAVGTKAVPKPAAVNISFSSKAGVNFEYKKVIKNVSMTAYSSEEPGIGTRTASGTRVTEGRTIAVDPRVIPIGWWVYIEGLGFRRAEDTGGAIKGHKIDVYYDSLSHARSFGRKSCAVYVIGPVKPELD
ncbi:3D domain-containing protein [Paenibacillus zanthoxyli]|uniref:3D domain-containing protein n=1 Tax=Paenibacillus zanthoxyli TaxID=369399 RepID=UPI00046E8262|nr:3D domain-containing protein [Paenibacillus zanthoxyli]